MTEATVQTRKPSNSAIKQQRLKACQPIITPKTIFPILLAMSIIIAPLGGLLYYLNNKALELSIDYTNCETEAQYDIFDSIPSRYVIDSIPKSRQEEHNIPKWKRVHATIPPNNKTITICSIRFYINKEMLPPVYLYYRLTNFYQNERSYSKSLDNNQLKGKAVYNFKHSGCKNIAIIKNTIIYPCGLLPNSMFNDTIGNLTLVNQNSQNESSPMSNETYNFTYYGIAPPGEAAKYKPTTYNISSIQPPKNWVERYPNGTYTEDYPPIDPSKDEHFQVWMQVAGLPVFRKMYGKNITTSLQAGFYQININSVFPVKNYGGTKSIVISTTSLVGNKHPFLGIAYIIIGILCGFIGTLLAIESLFNSHRRRVRRYDKIKNNKKH